VSILGPIAALFFISRATGAAGASRLRRIGWFVVRIDAFMVLLVREENAPSAATTPPWSTAWEHRHRPHPAAAGADAEMLRTRLLAIFAPLRRNIVSTR